MRIARGRVAGAASEQRSATFTGGVWADPILPPEDGIVVNAVFFEPGARTHWHAHSIAQVLYVTHGEGYLQTRDGTGGRLTPGDVAHIAAGEEHWHGAGPGTCMLHVAVSVGEHEWLEPVADEDYAQVFAG